MKFLTILALFGHISALKLSEEWRPNPAQSPWAAKAKDAPASTKITNAFKLSDNQSSFYKRETPKWFQAENDDRLMWSLINKYTLEGNTNG